MITIENYWMGRDVAHAADLTPEIRANAQVTVERCNKLLDLAGGGKTHVVTSGWRPLSRNSRTAGASTTSKHLSAEAADISDDDRYLADWSVANLDVLEEVGIWMEDPRWTPSWVHWQIIPPKSGRRIYIPSLAKPLDPDYPVTWA